MTISCKAAAPRLGSGPRQYRRGRPPAPRGARRAGADARPPGPPGSPGPSSPQRADPRGRPDAQVRTADDVPARDGTELPGVEGVAAVVAHHEDGSGGRPDRSEVDPVDQPAVLDERL